MPAILVCWPCSWKNNVKQQKNRQISSKSIKIQKCGLDVLTAIITGKIKVWIWIGDQCYPYSEVCGWFRGLQQLVAGKFTSRARRRPQNERFRAFSPSAQLWAGERCQPRKQTH